MTPAEKTGQKIINNLFLADNFLAQLISQDSQ